MAELSRRVALAHPRRTDPACLDQLAGLGETTYPCSRSNAPTQVDRPAHHNVATRTQMKSFRGRDGHDRPGTRKKSIENEKRRERIASPALAPPRKAGA